MVRLSYRASLQSKGWVGAVSWGLVLLACTSANTSTPRPRQPQGATDAAPPATIPSFTVGEPNWVPSALLAAPLTSASPAKSASKRPAETKPHSEPIALPVPQGYFVVAHGASTYFGWGFSTAGLDGRLVIEATPIGVGATRLRELKGSRWLEVDDLTKGLPELGRLDLAADANSPWRHVGHKADTIDYASCPNAPRYSGDRSVMYVGRWPDYAWAMVQEYGEEWCTQLSTLYRWKQGRFVKIFRTGEVGDFFVSVLAWQQGVAVLEDLECATRVNGVGHRRVLAFFGSNHTLLTELRNDKISNVGLTVLGSALVLYGNGLDDRIELVAWENRASVRRQRLQATSNATNVTVQENRMTFTAADGEKDSVSVDATFDGQWHESKPHPPIKDPRSMVELEHLFPPNLGITVTASWRSNGRDWLAVEYAGGSGNPKETWLLSNQPAPSVWELPYVEYHSDIDENCRRRRGPSYIDE